MSDRTSDFAQNAKNLIALNSAATLSTISAAHAGYPFGSIVPYDIDDAGRIVIFISQLSEHYKNLVQDNRSSLFVLEQSGPNNPQAHSRATILARFSPVPEAERAAVSTRYFERFPRSPGRKLEGDFVFFCALPERIRWIGGFGEIGWVEEEQFRNALLDQEAYRAGAER